MDEMGLYYQDLDFPHFDYGIVPCPRVDGKFIRGPAPDLDKPYFVCVGAAQTFGRFCNIPYPGQLSSELGMPVLNLGLAGSGPKTFLDSRFLELINRAEFAIVQVLSGRSASNSCFTNDASGGPNGIRLRDQKTMRFEAFLREELQVSTREAIATLVQETQENWVSDYEKLMDAITVPKILHWFSRVSPRRLNDYSSLPRLLGHFPQLVIRSMVDRVASRADCYVETVSSDGMPQALWPAPHLIDGTECTDGMLYNNYYPSPQMHAEAVSKLISPCKKLIGSS